MGHLDRRRCHLPGLRGLDPARRQAHRKRGRPGSPGKGAALLAVGVAFFLAELGDKTMLATIAMATRENWVGTWIGSTLGMVAADALAIVVGARLGKKLPDRVLRFGASAAFVIFGVMLVIEGVTSR